MRVLHVVPSYLPATRYGGPIYSVHGLCKALAARGHEVHVFTTNVDGPGDSDVPLGQPVDLDGVKVWYFPSRWLRRLYFAPAMKRALARCAGDFDIVHLHSVFLWPTWAAARAAWRARVPYVIAPRGMLVQDLVLEKSRWVKTAWIRLIERRNLKRAAAVHVTAPLEQSEMEKFGLDLPPAFVVPNGIEPPAPDSAETQDRAITPQRPYVLFLGRVNWKKGLDRLVQAWSEVDGAELVIAGNDDENYQAELEALAGQTGVADRVRFAGAAYGPDKWRLYRNAELFVLPSYSENFGTVVLEAMAMACPVVVTPEVGLASTVAEAGAGLVVPGEPKELAHALNRLLADPGLRLQMGRSGQQRVESDFLWPGVARQMEHCYERLVGARVTRACHSTS